MKKYILFILLLLCTLSGCKDNNKENFFSLTAKNLYIEIDKTDNLPIELTNLKMSDLQFDFSNTNIVQLVDDILLPINIGETILTITYKDIVKELYIKVTKVMPSIRISGDYLEVGTTSRVDVINQNNKDFNWIIDDEAIISLSMDDDVYHLTANKIGYATVRVTSKADPDLTKSITVEVREVAPFLEAPIKLLKVGDTTQMIITNLDNKTLDDYDWQISDEAILNLDDNYQITATKEGKAIITITSKTNNLVQDILEITVAKPNTETNSKGEPSKGPLFLLPGNTQATVTAGEEIEVKILGVVSNYNYRWRPLDPTIVAATDQGVIMGIKAGRTTLTVWSKEDVTIRGEIDITVTGTPNVDYAKRIVEAGLSEENYTAKSDKSNKFGDWFMYDKVDWCAIFVSWCVNQAGIGIDTIPKFALVSDGVRWFKNKDQYRDQGEYQPKAGDIIFFHRDGRISHVGIVTGSDSEKVFTIEGNTSNGVHQRSYLLTDTYVLGYGLPAYPPFTK